MGFGGLHKWVSTRRGSPEDRKRREALKMGNCCAKSDIIESLTEPVGQTLAISSTRTGYSLTFGQCILKKSGFSSSRNPLPFLFAYLLSDNSSALICIATLSSSGQQLVNILGRRVQIRSRRCDPEPYPPSPDPSLAITSTFCA